jgi:hypothetical protein
MSRRDGENMTIQDFAELLQASQVARYQRDYPNLDAFHPMNAIVTIKPGNKYTRIDVGLSGKYMVVNATGEIFGIKAYGVIHRGHRYGTLDTIDAWDWSGYTAVPIRKVATL